MKKKLLPILLLSLYSGAAMAQATLTAATTNPVPGEIITEYAHSITDPGASGENATWDFSNASSSSSEDEDFTTCAASQYCNGFQNVTVAANTPSAGASILFNTSNSALTIVGEYGSGVSFVYSNGEDVLHYPFTYNNTYSDPFTATFTSAGYEFYRSGTVTVTCDGSGTLILPYATFDNALRIHRVENYQDSTDLAGVIEVLHYQSDIYNWYTTTNRAELMSIVSLTINGVPSQTYGYYTKQIASSVNNINEPAELNIFPNPANGVVNIRYSNINGNNIRISIADVTGREVAVINGANNQQVQYNTSNLQAGVYFVCLQTDNGTVTKKLEVL